MKIPTASSATSFLKARTSLQSIRRRWQRWSACSIGDPKNRSAFKRPTRSFTRWQTRLSVMHWRVESAKPENVSALALRNGQLNHRLRFSGRHEWNIPKLSQNIPSVSAFSNPRFIPLSENYRPVQELGMLANRRGRKDQICDA